MTTRLDRSQTRAAISDELLRQRTVWASFIAGAFVDIEDAVQIPVLEAATGRPLAQVATANAITVDRAVNDSRAAYEDTWRDLSPKERGALLREVAALVREHADELAELVAREVGKPRRDARRVDIVSCHSGFDYYAGIAETVHGEILDQGPIEARVAYEPYGVVAAILPFNWPPIHFAKKCAPALAAGNTVVVKPGEQAPLTVLRLVELANQVLPPGIVNAVTGIEAGAALASHPRVERISFTGATATGRKVLESAAKNLTYATLELGGKNALIVLEDADLNQALTVAIEGMFYNQGEACTSTSRILVHSSLYDDFARQFVERTAFTDRRRSAERGDRHRTACGRAPTRQSAGTPRGWAQRGRRSAVSGRRADRRADERRIFRGPRGARQCHARHDGRAGRDLRAGGQPDAVRNR